MAQLQQSQVGLMSPSTFCYWQTSLFAKFDESSVDDFFVLFEELARGMEWPREHWPVIVQSILIRKAQAPYVSADSIVRQDYELLKGAILDVYQLRPKAYRQTFRDAHKRSDQTHRQFIHDMIEVFNHWFYSSSVNTFETLKELILLENFPWKIERKVPSFLRDKKVHSLDEVPTKADDYFLNQKLNKPLASKENPGSL